MTVLLLTAFTLIAFAANSVICRMALGGHVIDPISFTTLRLAGGALMLALISAATTRSRPTSGRRGSWLAGSALFGYAVAFSLAYVSLNTGTGALILFGAVQVTMIGAALISGERLGSAQWIGSVIATGGLVYLVLPGLAAPDPVGALLMAIAGASWGVYSILGRGAPAPLGMTTGNFLRATPMAVAVSLLAAPSLRIQAAGVGLALFSGAVTSGLGYVLWYRVLKSLSTTQASVVQLLVPVLAAFGGVMLLSEHVTLRLVTASVLILGGVSLAVLKRPAVDDSSELSTSAQPASDVSPTGS